MLPCQNSLISPIQPSVMKAEVKKEMTVKAFSCLAPIDESTAVYGSTLNIVCSRPCSTFRTILCTVASVQHSLKDDRTGTEERVEAPFLRFEEGIQAKIVQRPWVGPPARPRELHFHI